MYVSSHFPSPSCVLISPGDEAVAKTGCPSERRPQRTAPARPPKVHFAQDVGTRYFDVHGGAGAGIHSKHTKISDAMLSTAARHRRRRTAAADTKLMVLAAAAFVAGRADPVSGSCPGPTAEDMAHAF